MQDSVFLAELPWPEAARRIAENAVVLLPVGATEQHGRHMPLNVDVVLPTAIAERVARNLDGLVAPTIAYGNRSQPRSGGGPTFPGTVNIAAHTLTLLIRDVILDLFRQNVRRLIVLNGHYENISPTVEAIELALDAIGRDRARQTRLIILRVDHWELVRPETIARIFPDGFPGIELEHASVIETSMMLALRPDLVDLSAALHDGPARFKPYDRYPVAPEEVPPSGVLSLTQGSSPEKGEWLIGDIVDRLTQFARAEFALKASET